MITNSIFAATICLLAALLFVLQECTFLVPYRQLIWNKYASIIVAFAALLFFNLFALFYLLMRKIFLKDTGQKLAHLEKQLRSGGAISEELARRLEE
jgi:hypothetical protein